MSGWAIMGPHGRLVRGTLATRRMDAWCVLPGLREPYQTVAGWIRAKRRRGYRAVRVFVALVVVR